MAVAVTVAGGWGAMAVTVPVNGALAVTVAGDGPIPSGWIVLIAAATGDWSRLGWPQARAGMGWVGPAATRGWRGMGWLPPGLQCAGLAAAEYRRLHCFGFQAPPVPLKHPSQVNDPYLWHWLS